MPRLLLAVDGSPNSLKAVKFALRISVSRARSGEIHVLNVQPPLPAAASEFVAADVVRGYHQEEGNKALKRAVGMLKAADCNYKAHVVVGDVAMTIARSAIRWKCDQIVMGTRGYGAIQGLLLGSVTSKVLHLAEVPVTLVK